MPEYTFHPEALLEYAEAASYYAHKASPEIAERFVTSVEAGIAEVTADPERWRVVAEPEIRRCILQRFPYVVYYRWTERRVVVYAVMHSSRAPGYWRKRIL